jgi:hypothetical protein
MNETLPPLPDLPPAEVEEWGESFITFIKGEGWKKETVEKYATDYARAAIQDFVIKGNLAPEGKLVPAVPEGWKLVPIEPTPEMMIAGKECEDMECGNPEAVKHIYRAMLSATAQSVDDNSPSDLDHDPQQEGEAPAILPQPAQQVAHKPLFVEMIAEHPGLREELEQQAAHENETINRLRAGYPAAINAAIHEQALVVKQEPARE